MSYDPKRNDPNRKPSRPPQEDPDGKRTKSIITMVVIALVFTVVINMVYTAVTNASLKQITNSEFDDLLEAIGKRLDSGASRVTIHLPYDKGGMLDKLYQEAKVEKVEYSATIDVVAVCVPKVIGQLGQFVEGWVPPKEPWED